MEQKYEDEIQMLHQEIEMLEAEREEMLRSIFIQHGDRLQEELLAPFLGFCLVSYSSVNCKIDKKKKKITLSACSVKSL